jgi:serine/threonine-protein kinase
MVACQGGGDKPPGPGGSIPPGSGPTRQFPTPPRYFPDSAVWYRDVSQAPVDPESPKVIGRLAAMGGFGTGDMVVDFDFEVLSADGAAPMRDFTQGRGFYEPDCDFMTVPVPLKGAIEGMPAYECLTGGDCHLIVHHLPTHRLYEMWRADISDGVFTGGCLAVWDLTRVYGPTGRGLDCTSADAAGYPIAALLFTADEVDSGEIPHAVRFVLPNDRIRTGVYLTPATHSTGAAKGTSETPPFGARLRLRADFPVTLLPAGAQVVARALQRYGMFLADGGMKALTAQSDRYTRAKWSTPQNHLLGERDLVLLKISDFEMIDGGERIPFDGECVRDPL